MHLKAWKRPFPDLEVIEALTMLQKTEVIALTPMNITIVYTDVQIDDSFVQGIYDLSCSSYHVSLRTTHLEVYAIILAIVEDVTMIVITPNAIHGSKNNEMKLSSPVL